MASWHHPTLHDDDVLTGRSYRRSATVVLAVIGALALISAIVAEITDQDPHAELAAGMLGGVVLILAATTADTGNRLRYDLLLAGAMAFILGIAGLSRLTPGRAALLLYVPAVAGFGATLLLSRRAAGVAAVLARERQRARADGEERERERWARELHDDTLQELGALRVLLAMAAKNGDAAVMTNAINDAQALIGKQITALRHLITEVRPMALVELGLVPALSSLVERTSERSRMTVRLRCNLADDTRLPTEIEGAIYRITQEALNNAARHSAASTVEVAVQMTHNEVTVTVTDDGIGLPPAATRTNGLGLLGMRERATMLGGRLDTVTNPHGAAGTAVIATVPIRPAGQRRQTAPAS